MSSFKKKIISGSLWSVGGQFLSLAISLISNIWLARLLSPDDFGRVGIIMFFISIAYVLIEGGLSAALIRKKSPSDEDYSTVFFFNLFVALCMFLIIFLFAGKISEYYNDAHLSLPLICASIVIIFNAFQLVPSVKIMVDMRFKEKAIYEFIATLLSSVVGILLAYKGLGIWAIILMNILKSFFLVIILNIFSFYRIRLIFSRSSFESLFSFGVNTTLSSLIIIAFDNIYQLVLGKYFSLSQVGFYYQAKRLQDVLVNLFSVLSNGVFYSGLSKIQEDKDHFTYSYNTFISFLMIILGIIILFTYNFASLIVTTLYGAKWLEAGYYLQMLVISSLFFIQESFNRVIFKIFNKTGLILKLEIIKKIFQMISIVVGIYYHNIMLLLIGLIISNGIGYFINSYVASKIIDNEKHKEVENFIKLCGILLIEIILIEISKQYFNNLYSIILFIIGIIPSYLIVTGLLKVFNFKQLFRDIKKLKR